MLRESFILPHKRPTNRSNSSQPSRGAKRGSSEQHSGEPGDDPREASMLRRGRKGRGRDGSNLLSLLPATLVNSVGTGLRQDEPQGLTLSDLLLIPYKIARRRLVAGEGQSIPLREGIFNLVRNYRPRSPDKRFLRVHVRGLE
jgi:hypothetical protein